MFRHYFEGIKNVETGPVIALVLFFIFFLIMIAWIFKLDKKFIHKMKNLPLDEEDVKSNE